MYGLSASAVAREFAGDRADASARSLPSWPGTKAALLVFETLANARLRCASSSGAAIRSGGYSPALERMLPPALGPCLRGHQDRGNSAALIRGRPARASGTCAGEPDPDAACGRRGR